MNVLKKLLGIIWLISGPVVIYFLISNAIKNIGAGGTKDINNPVIWIIIIAIFLPIAIGLMIFGWYALKNEYAHLPQNSGEV